jgi:hypothetical protein
MKNFMLSLSPGQKQLLVDVLLEALPPYICATDAVLAEIAALPKGAVTSSTKLSEIPIEKLFARNAAPINAAKIWGDKAFAGGRDEHDVKWLRGSLKELKTLLRTVIASKNGADVDADLNAQFTNQQNYFTSDDDYELMADFKATSRFYCNAGIRILKEPGQAPQISVYESCD